MNFNLLFWLEIAYWAGVLFVVVGVILEGAEIWHRRKFFRKPAVKPVARDDEPRPWVHNCGDLGWLLLVVGLVLELVCGFVIDAVKTAELKELTESLEATQIKLSIADARLTNTENDTARAQRQAALARRETAFLNSNNLVLRSNLFALEQNSPEKKPVFAASGFITFTTDATNFIKAESSAFAPDRKSVAGSLFLTRRSESFDSIATISLVADEFSQFGNRISMDLNWYPNFRRIVGTNRNETCEELINELNRGQFSGMLFKDTLSVSNASLTLVLNGVVRKEFKLGRYNRPPDGFPGVMFSLIEATNATITTH